jgi:hypothetical protein
MAAVNVINPVVNGLVFLASCISGYAIQPEKKRDGTCSPGREDRAGGSDFQEGNMTKIDPGDLFYEEGRA